MAEAGEHKGHMVPRHSVAEADIGHSVAGNDRIDAGAGVRAADVEGEARMTRTGYDMEEVHVSDDVLDALTGVALGSGEGVDVEAGGVLAGVGDVGAEAVVRTNDVVAAGVD